MAATSLEKSIAAIWRDNATLCALIPFARVFTGRVPSTQLYRFPYVSILCTAGVKLRRSDKTRHSMNPVSFHVWVDDNQLEAGKQVARAITDAYAENNWALDDGAKVNDVFDDGEPQTHQVNIQEIKAWEVVKVMHVVIEQARVSAESACLTETVQPATRG